MQDVQDMAYMENLMKRIRSLDNRCTNKDTSGFNSTGDGNDSNSVTQTVAFQQVSIPNKSVEQPKEKIANCSSPPPAHDSPKRQLDDAISTDKDLKKQRSEQPVVNLEYSSSRDSPIDLPLSDEKENYLNIRDKSNSNQGGSRGGLVVNSINSARNSNKITSYLVTASGKPASAVVPQPILVDLPGPLSEVASPKCSQPAVTEPDLSASTVPLFSAKKGKEKQTPVNTPGDSSDSRSLMNVITELKRQLEQMKQAKDLSDSKSSRLELENKSLHENIKLMEERSSKLTKSLQNIYKSTAITENRRKRETIAADCVRLGKIVMSRTPSIMETQFTEMWEEGYALKDLRVRESALFRRREELDERKRKLSSMARSHARNKLKASSSCSDLSVLESVSLPGDATVDLELATESETIRYHMDQFKQEELQLAEERKILEADKASHLKELRRIRNEDDSVFARDLKCLHNNRYQLVHLLGKGGFSEVWKAMDLVELREVALKIHKLHPAWTEDKKENYIKHVTREYQIHKDMTHPRIVLLYDVFEIDENSFATVLEFCRGIDLDEKLKRCKSIPEKDAKPILMQILMGLKYLNTPQLVSVEASGAGEVDAPDAVQQPPAVRRKGIIHYDLKPANILFDEFGDVKITDFGLSKVIDDSTSDSDTSVDLTSMGAGTYWYLPPETFAPQNGGHGTLRISSKVDVWSVGVIYYQMLFGKRPFGEGRSQEAILREGTILGAHQVEFPSSVASAPSSGVTVGGNVGGNVHIPKVSEEAKEFIRACLAYDQQHRPDVHALCLHSYVRNNSKK